MLTSLDVVDSFSYSLKTKPQTVDIMMYERRSPVSDRHACTDRHRRIEGCFHTCTASVYRYSPSIQTQCGVSRLSGYSQSVKQFL